MNEPMTKSPGLMFRTSLPASSTIPAYSWPIGVGWVTGSMPRYGHRSEPHTQVAARRMITSVGSMIVGSSRCSTRTSPGAYRIAPRMMTGSLSACAGRRGGHVVLLTGDVLEPGGPVVLSGALVQGDVDHEAVRGGPVPVLLAWRGVDDLPRAGGDDVAVAGADQCGALGYIKGLADGVGVPGRAGAGGEVDAAARHPGRL